jgi:hypothetical protein
VLGGDGQHGAGQGGKGGEGLQGVELGQGHEAVVDRV